jgi:hypothetical protein
VNVPLPSGRNTPPPAKKPEALANRPVPPAKTSCVKWKAPVAGSRTSVQLGFSW